VNRVPGFSHVAVLLCLAVGLASCAPVQQPFGTPYRAPAITDDTLITADAARLPLRQWEAENPAALIIGVHGFNDYSRAFELAGPWFAARNISFYAYDQRGFGLAPGRGRWAGHAALMSDLATFVGLMKTRYPHVPIYVVGASMGGAVTLAAATQELAVDGLILAAPAVWGWSSMNFFLKAPLWLGAHTTPAWTLTGEGLERWPSDNIEMLRALSQDPNMIRETRIDAIYGLVSLMDKAYLSVPEIEKPVLLLYGEKDEIVPAAPIAEIAKRFRSPLTFKTYPDGWHMLLRDKQRETVWRDMKTWIDDRQRDMAPLALSDGG